MSVKLFFSEFKHFVKNNKLPIFIVLCGFACPVIIWGYTEYQLVRLNKGIKKDMDRVKSKGRRLSDIPKTML